MLLYSSDLCRHQITSLSGLTYDYVRMRVVVHSLAIYGANTTRSAVPVGVFDDSDTFIHIERRVKPGDQR